MLCLNFAWLAAVATQLLIQHALGIVEPAAEQSVAAPACGAATLDHHFAEASTEHLNAHDE